MKNRKVRITLSSFDFIKGIAMISIILLHMLNNDHFVVQKLPFFRPFLISLRASGYIIPMFFIISGFGFKPMSAVKVLKKTFSEMVIPYLWVMFVISVLYPIVFYIQNYSWTESFHFTMCFILAYFLGVPEYGKVFLGYNIAWVSAVWYLLALFVAFNVLNLILKTKNITRQFILVLLCVLAGYVLIIREINYYCIAHGLMAVGFCYTGYTIKKCKLLERYLNCVWLYITLIPVTLVQATWGFFNMGPGEFRYGLFDYIGAGLAGVLFMFIGVYFGQFECKATAWIKQIGVYTYWILCIHSVEMGFPQWAVLTDMLTDHQQIAFIIEVILKAFLIVAVCCILRKISKYRYRRSVIHNGR